MRVEWLQVTTDENGDGAATKALPAGASYLLHAVEWIDGDLVDGVDAVLKCVSRAYGPDLTMLTLTNANADNVYFPRELEDDNVGAALTTYTLPVVDGTLQLVIASGGDTKSGGARVILLEA